MQRCTEKHPSSFKTETGRGTLATDENTLPCCIYHHRSARPFHEVCGVRKLNVKQMNTLCCCPAVLCCCVLPVLVQPNITLQHKCSWCHANSCCVTVCVCACVSFARPHHHCRVHPSPPPPPTLVSSVFLCVCSPVLTPALLLNNPGYHVVLSDDRKGSRALGLPSTGRAQEKSLNVPQGKRAGKGPAERGLLTEGDMFGSLHESCLHYSQSLLIIPVSVLLRTCLKGWFAVWGIMRSY